jgi:hypothetical protein
MPVANKASQVRALQRYDDPDEQADVWKRAVEAHQGKAPSRSELTEFVKHFAKKVQKSRLADARNLPTRYKSHLSPAGSGFAKAQLHATLLLPLPSSAGRPYSTKGR